MTKQQDNKDKTGRIVTILFMVAFSLLTIGYTIYNGMLGRTSFMIRGFFFPLFLLIPVLFRLLRLQHCWRLYCMLYAFIMFAYSYGCVYGSFTRSDVMDKVSHFFSGFVFTIFGMCIYYLLAGPKPGGLRQDWALAATYGLFFSMFVAVAWEVCEYFDFALTGNDSQNHLTTGVMDTMQDLMACLLASLISAGALVLFRFVRIKLLTAGVVEEFYDKNVAGRKPRAGRNETKQG